MGNILYDIVIQPLVFVIDLTFSLAFKLLKDPGLSIIVVSIVVNALCSPLYRMADARQDEEREKQKSMEGWVSHIKEHFKGDEQYMMLSTYYRQQHYSQLSQLTGSVSLLLQIPVFMAAYGYLSGLAVLKGSPFLMISDLGSPDALLTIGGMAVNVLPLVMTALNLVSSALYTRGLPLKDKVQPFVLALVFLVLLYRSPSGLVFYWTCNQVFSLVRNVVTKVARPSAKAVRVIAQACVIAGAAGAVALGIIDSTKRLVAVVALLGIVEWLLWHPRKAADKGVAQEGESSTRSFVLAAVLLSVLVGVVVPSALIGASPAEFLLANSAANPLLHIAHVLCVALGFFGLWLGVFFWLASPEGREGLARALFMLCGVCLVDYFVVLKALGVINTSLMFDDTPKYAAWQQVASLALACAAAFACYVVWQRRRKAVVPALAILTMTMAGLAAPNLLATSKAADAAAALVEQQSENRARGQLFDVEGNPLPIIRLSRTAKNVVVLFLDRGLDCYVPYLLNERPELAQQFDGFTYYPNTLSFGQYTVFGSPAVYGGYDYSMQAMNERDDVLLEDKHREALLLMPRLFSAEGYVTTMIDGPVVDYHYSATEFPAIETVKNATYYHAAGAYDELLYEEQSARSKERFRRNIVYYSLFGVTPAFAKSFVYDNGHYLEPVSENGSGALSAIPQDFISHYATVKALPLITEADDTAQGSLVLFNTEETHEPALLQLPDYELPGEGDAPAVEEDYDRFTLDGVTLKMDNETKLAHYHVNMAAFLRLGEWFDKLRELGVYDNTRIIIVSDHGRGLGQLESLKVAGLIDGGDYDAEWVNPLFLVKDFDAHGFTTSDEFMTNADTPALALAGIVENPVNPATGNPVTSEEKTAHDQLVNTSRNWHLGSQRGTTFDTPDGVWLSVHDDIFDDANWTYIGSEL